MTPIDILFGGQLSLGRYVQIGGPNRVFACMESNISWFKSPASFADSGQSIPFCWFRNLSCDLINDLGMHVT